MVMVSIPCGPLGFSHLNEVGGEKSDYTSRSPSVFRVFTRIPYVWMVIRVVMDTKFNQAEYEKMIAGYIKGRHYEPVEVEMFSTYMMSPESWDKEYVMSEMDAEDCIIEAMLETIRTLYDMAMANAYHLALKQDPVSFIALHLSEDPTLWLEDDPDAQEMTPAQQEHGVFLGGLS